MGSVAGLEPGGGGHAHPARSDVAASVRVHRVHQDTRDTYTLNSNPSTVNHWPGCPASSPCCTRSGSARRPISISGDPSRPDRIEHTIRNVGSVTAALVAAAPGTVLGVRGPFGTGWDVGTGRGGDVVVVAGGIGLAPLRPAILELITHRADYDRVVLLYGARDPRGHPVHR